MRMAEEVFTYLIMLQFVVVVSHDWVTIPGWTHGRQVERAIGRQKLLLATLINAVFPGVAVILAFWYWGKRQPSLVHSYWAIYCVITVLSAITMWYVPYLVGATPQKADEYARMYAGTRQILPARGNNPRPNLLHVCFHILFVITATLALAIRFRTP